MFNVLAAEARLDQKVGHSKNVQIEFRRRDDNNEFIAYHPRARISRSDNILGISEIEIDTLHKNGIRHCEYRYLQHMSIILFNHDKS